jgi:predicted nucleic acid-binding protein
MQSVLKQLDYLDINVLIALAVENHTLGPAAFEYLNSNLDKQFLCSNSSMMGFLRVTSLLKDRGQHIADPESAISTWMHLTKVLNCHHIAEPIISAEAISERFANRLSRTMWTDYYLLMIAESAQARFITFDQGLVAVDNSNILVLRPN